ncbi:MAG: ATP-dependent protease ClpP protease subunit, partial [Bacteroidia bacterium]
MMNDESKDVKLPSLNFLDEKLFKSRSISIFGQINERVARSVTEQLLA